MSIERMKRIGNPTRKMYVRQAKPKDSLYPSTVMRFKSREEREKKLNEKEMAEKAARAEEAEKGNEEVRSVNEMAGIANLNDRPSEPAKSKETEKAETPESPEKTDSDIPEAPKAPEVPDPSENAGGVSAEDAEDVKVVASGGDPEGSISGSEPGDMMPGGPPESTPEEAPGEPIPGKTESPESAVDEKPNGGEGVAAEATETPTTPAEEPPVDINETLHKHLDGMTLAELKALAKEMNLSLKGLRLKDDIVESMTVRIISGAIADNEIPANTEGKDLVEWLINAYQA